MNWDAAGAVGEIIGAAAVVASVIYLAVQIRKQTQEARLQATRELAEQYIELLNTLIMDEELAALYLRGVQDYANLENAERLRVALIYQKTARLMEQQQLHTQASNVDAKYFVSTNKAFDEFVTFPGMQIWWQNNRKHFEEEFASHVDEKIAKARAYNSTFGNTDESAT